MPQRLNLRLSSATRSEKRAAVRRRYTASRRSLPLFAPCGQALVQGVHRTETVLCGQTCQDRVEQNLRNRFLKFDCARRETPHRIAHTLSVHRLNLRSARAGVVWRCQRRICARSGAAGEEKAQAAYSCVRTLTMSQPDAQAAQPLAQAVQHLVADFNDDDDAPVHTGEPLQPMEQLLRDAFGVM